MISVMCPWCSHILKVDEKHIWKKWECPKCWETVDVVSEEPQSDKVEVYEQSFNTWKQKKEWLFSGEKASKIAIAIIILAVIWWNAYVYFHNKKVKIADQFVAIYNQSMTAIQWDLQIIQDKSYATQIEIWLLQADLEKLQKLIILWVGNLWDIQNKISSIENEMNDIKQVEEEVLQSYSSIYAELNIIHDEACVILIKSQQDCINFITAYQKFIEWIQEWNENNLEGLTSDMTQKNNTFKITLIEDWIEIQ